MEKKTEQISFSNGEERKEKSAFSPAETERIVELSLDDLHDFPSHPFHVRQDAALEEMTESIRQNGVLVPALVRPRAEGGYELISGHRRRLACRLAGLSAMPCVVRDMDDDKAVIIMVDSNLQRESLLPSEKAFAYRMKLEAARRQQGARTDLTSATPLRKSEKKSTRELLAENSPDSHEQIRRYIRLTYLIPALLERVDKGKLPMRCAVELSYLSEQEQLMLSYFIAQTGRLPSRDQSVELRRLSAEGSLGERSILSVLQRRKKAKPASLRIPSERISVFFAPGASPQTIEDTIVKALALYRKTQGQVNE